MCNLSYGIEQRGIEIGLERGIEQGIQQGIEQGVEQGRIKILTKQLFKKYHMNLKEWLMNLNKEQLEKIEDLVLEELNYDEFMNNF